MIPFFSMTDARLEHEVYILSLKSQKKVLEDFLNSKINTPRDYSALWEKAKADTAK